MKIPYPPSVRFSSLQISQTSHKDMVRLVVDVDDAQTGDVFFNGTKIGHSPVVANLTRGLKSALAEGTDAFQKASGQDRTGGLNAPELTKLEDYIHRSITTHLGSDAQVKNKIIGVLEGLSLYRSVATVKALGNPTYTDNGIEYRRCQG